MSKYQKSLSGKECIGFCELPNQELIHPQTFNTITHKSKPFCPVKVEKPGDPEIDECEGPNYDQTIWIEKEFDSAIFLKFYYNITTFYDCVNWVTDNNNKKKSLFTRLRVMNCGWKAFGSKDLVITDDLVDFYMFVSKRLWLDKNNKNNKNITKSVIYKFLEAFSRNGGKVKGMVNFERHMFSEFTDFIKEKYNI